LVLMGTICGDIIGSWYEFSPIKRYDFEFFTDENKFTDDTICTIGIADALIHNEPFEPRLKSWCLKYPRAGYGGMFSSWMHSYIKGAYNSWGNGSAMRVSPIGAYVKTIEECLSVAKQSAEITHNHPEGVKGAQAVASAIFLALHGCDKKVIKDYIETEFCYDLSRSYKDIQPLYSFEVSCQKSVPESIIAFLESYNYESAIRLAVAYGGDADTMAAISGGVAAAYYGEIPDFIISKCKTILSREILSVIDSFNTILI
ncbi:MAG: ADP-ribosylglycohydrolase family protein, partial [Muribaculaceae bacterium]|nr:ADP-ribosylglycohydrolase family protein [Muribaculaceae bacterium]